jgi:hypothetical protein
LERGGREVLTTMPMRETELERRRLYQVWKGSNVSPAASLLHQQFPQILKQPFEQCCDFLNFLQKFLLIQIVRIRTLAAAAGSNHQMAMTLTDLFFSFRNSSAAAGSSSARTRAPCPCPPS